MTKLKFKTLKEKLQLEFENGDYFKVISAVDSIYGWTQEELNQVNPYYTREYNRETAEWCLEQL